MAFGNGLLAKVTIIRLTKVTFIRRAKVRYLCLEIVQFVNGLRPSQSIRQRTRVTLYGRSYLHAWLLPACIRK